MLVDGVVVTTNSGSGFNGACVCMYVCVCLCVCIWTSHRAFVRQATHKSAIRDKTTFLQCEVMSALSINKYLKMSTIAIERLIRLFIQSEHTAHLFVEKKGELKEGFKQSDLTTTARSSSQTCSFGPDHRGHCCMLKL